MLEFEKLERQIEKSPVEIVRKVIGELIKRKGWEHIIPTNDYLFSFNGYYEKLNIFQAEFYNSKLSFRSKTQIIEALDDCSDAYGVEEEIRKIKEKIGGYSVEPIRKFISALLMGKQTVYIIPSQNYLEENFFDYYESFTKFQIDFFGPKLQTQSKSQIVECLKYCILSYGYGYDDGDGDVWLEILDRISVEK